MGLINSKKTTVVADEVRYASPNGLYPSCSWDLKMVRKLIVERKLAPFYPGNEEKLSAEHDECPICFFFYPGGLNRTRCCKKGVCTECYLQIKKPNVPPTEATCPFCNRNKFAVLFSGPKSIEERAKEDEEDLKVIKLQQKIRDKEIKAEKEREEKKEKERKLTMSQQKGKERQQGESEAQQSPRQQPAQQPHQQAQDAPAVTPAGAQVQPSGSPEKDLDDLMLMEAIRLSLMEKSSSQGQSTSKPASPHRESPEEPKHASQAAYSDLFGFEKDGSGDFDSRLHKGEEGEREKEKEKEKDKGEREIKRSKSKKGKGKGKGKKSSKSKKMKREHARKMSTSSEGEEDNTTTTTTTTTTPGRAKRGRTASSPVPIEDTPLGQTPPMEEAL